MMNTNIKMIIAASCGAIGGAVLASVVTCIVSRRKEKKAVESALEAQRGLYEGYITSKKRSDERKDQNVAPEGDVAENNPSEKTEDSIMRKANVNRMDYSKTARIIENGQYAPVTQPGEGVYRAGPYLITEPQYREERLTYDKEVCNFFEPDGILLNEDNDEYEPMDISRDVGWSNLEEFSKDKELEELYVRNDNQSTDYYIKRIRHSVEDVE